MIRIKKGIYKIPAYCLYIYKQIVILKAFPFKPGYSLAINLNHFDKKGTNYQSIKTQLVIYL